MYRRRNTDGNTDRNRDTDGNPNSNGNADGVTDALRRNNNGELYGTGSCYP